MGDDGASWIPREREAPPLTVPAAMAATLVVVGSATALILLAARGSPLPAEGAYTRANTPHALLWTALDVSVARYMTAALGVVAITATWLAGRRLLRSDLAGLAAAGFVAIDPWFLHQGHLSLPAVPALALWTIGLAVATGRHPWVAGLPLAGAALVDPNTAWTAPAVAAMVLLRGNIYSGPQHVRRAVWATLVPPVATGILVAILSDTACLPGRRAIILQDILYTGGAAAHSPVTWFAGAGALALGATLAISHLASDARVSRVPGRIQARLSNPLPRVHGRSLWLLALAVVAPPTVMPVILALALGSTVIQLGDDAPGFGVAVLLALFAFAGVEAWQARDAILGTDTTWATRLAWSRLVGC